MGIDLDKLVPASVQKTREDDYELWPEHAMAWSVYAGCSTQWVKTRGWMGRPHWEGLNYAGVDVVMRRYGVPVLQRKEVFEQLQVLEAEALQLLNRV